MSILDRHPIDAMPAHRATIALGEARYVLIGCLRPDGGLRIDGVAGATTRGALPMSSPALAREFIETAQRDLARLMRLIAEGNSIAATSVAWNLVEKSRAVLEFGAPASVRARPLPNEDDATDAGAEAPRLSRRELDVLRMISQGLSNRQIAQMSHRSLHTINAHAKNIYRKLAVTSRAWAVREAMLRGLIELDVPR